MKDYLKKLNGKVAVITTENLGESTFYTKETPLEAGEFDIDEEDVILISDPNNELGKLFNITYIAMEEIKEIYKELGIEGKVEGYFDTSELNVPITLILTQKEGRIIYKFGKRDYTFRAPGSELLDTLLKLRKRKEEG